MRGWNGKQGCGYHEGARKQGKSERNGQFGALKLAQRRAGKLSKVSPIEDYQYVLDTCVKNNIDPEHGPVQEICARKEFTIGGPVRERETVRWPRRAEARINRNEARYIAHDDRNFNYQGQEIDEEEWSI